MLSTGRAPPTGREEDREPPNIIAGNVRTAGLNIWASGTTVANSWIGIADGVLTDGTYKYTLRDSNDKHLGNQWGIHLEESAVNCTIGSDEPGAGDYNVVISNNKIDGINSNAPGLQIVNTVIGIMPPAPYNFTPAPNGIAGGNNGIVLSESATGTSIGVDGSPNPVVVSENQGHNIVSAAPRTVITNAWIGIRPNDPSSSSKRMSPEETTNRADEAAAKYCDTEENRCDALFDKDPYPGILFRNGAANSRIGTDNSTFVTVVAGNVGGGLVK